MWLPSGGSLVIDRTEAMTVVDVNTGKFTGQGGNLEETVTRNNLEAAEEIVRQLRLRDVGGIIVIDFIDMVLESNRELVLRRLLECLARDRTKHQVAEVTSLGLVQMTRKRVGSGLLEAFSVPCELLQRARRARVARAGRSRAACPQPRPRRRPGRRGPGRRRPGWPAAGTGPGAARARRGRERSRDGPGRPPDERERHAHGADSEAVGRRATDGTRRARVGRRRRRGADVGPLRPADDVPPTRPMAGLLPEAAAPAAQADGPVAQADAPLLRPRSPWQAAAPDCVRLRARREADVGRSRRCSQPVAARRRGPRRGRRRPSQRRRPSRRRTRRPATTPSRCRRGQRPGPSDHTGGTQLRTGRPALAGSRGGATRGRSSRPDHGQRGTDAGPGRSVRPAAR